MSYMTAPTKPLKDLIAVAQSTADTGVSNAAAAQTAADNAQSTANTAVSNAATAQTAADNAQSTANTAVSNAATAQTAADNAQSTANTGVSNAATAQTAADNAQSTANSKMTQSTADGLYSKLAMGQTWQSPARSAGTTYQNTTGKPIMVFVQADYGGSLQTSPNNSSWTDHGAFNYVGNKSVVVPHGWYYKITTGAGAIYHWRELR